MEHTVAIVTSILDRFNRLAIIELSITPETIRTVILTTDTIVELDVIPLEVPSSVGAIMT